MRRADFLSLTDLSVDAFYSLERRGRLPFQRPAKGAWSDYSAVAALKMTFALALAEHGITQEDAAAFVRFEFKEAFERLTTHTAATPLYFGFAYVGSDGIDGETGRREISRTRSGVVGTWGEVGRKIAALAAQLRKGGESVFGVTLVDASQTLNAFFARAEALGILELVQRDFAAERERLTAEEEAAWDG